MSDSVLQQCRQVRLPDNPALSQLAVNAGRAPYASRIQLGLCGEQRTWIIGVNWYLNDYVRLMFDYAQADLSGYPLTTVAAARTSHSTDLPRCRL